MDTNGRDDVRLAVRAWWEPDLARNGHDPLGTYIERYWLPVLGPAATLAHRWFVRRLRDEPAGFDVTRGELARSLGLGNSRGVNGPAARAVERLGYFGLLRTDDASDIGPIARVEVRTHLPQLPEHLVRKLPREQREQLRSGSPDAQPSRTSESSSSGSPCQSDRS